MRLKIDLHDHYSDGRKLEAALVTMMTEAQEKKADVLEIIPGKGSGQLKKYVLRFLEKQYKGVYHRIEKDDKNWGRVFVHFRWGKI
ncbi:MAG TPA: DNA mismatch repair protein MutS [Candidatus Omnitrophica bacterium]|nr:MAG: DNA mismatch repair protein MutS [Omnitrophica WOR_2 bacterium GWA2_45_18]OGX18396.1 MAG: DNA mismatch repair protein MutS [Omnitrophica WOR_2 bacterium GWC2_45_7]HBR14863.1 DNA mismatch repair protein MutS [Candidatus Omnitrophota bacterium]